MSRLNDPAAVKEATRRDASRERQDIADLGMVLQTDAGRRLLWGLLEQGNVFGTVFSANGSQMCFNEGRRVAALDLFNRINVNYPDLYLTMAREAAASSATQREVKEA